MNVMKRLFLLLSLFAVIMPMGAMEQGDSANEGFFGKLWNLVKEYPAVAGFSIAASLLGVYAGKNYLQSKRNQALCFAVRDGNMMGVKAALVSGADINSKDFIDNVALHTALHIASSHGRLEIVKYLVSHGADIEAKDCCGDTPLHEAAGFGQLEVVKYLIDMGADIEAKNDMRRTPLHKAVIEGRLEVVKYLIDMGADIEAQDSWGETLLHVAASNNQLEIVKYLVTKGLGIEATCTHGQTPLHKASRAGGLEVVKYLVGIGADIEAKDIYGNTAFDPAMGNVWGHTNRLAIVLALIQRSHFVTPNEHTEESQKRVQATMSIAKIFGLPRDLGKKILSYVPEDLVNEDHAKVVFNYGSELKELVPHCPLRWFNKIYQDTYDSEKQAFLDKVVPIIVEYRLGKVKELLVGKTSQDPMLATIIDSDSVDQHRAAITMHVTNGIIGIQEEPESREE